jgi:hypothetical protein
MNGMTGTRLLINYKLVVDYKAGMIRFAKLQFLGPFIVAVAIAMAEAAAFALAHVPTSETLWYLNLTVFAIFQTSYSQLFSSWDLPYMQLYLIAFPLFSLAVVGLFARRQFLLALASHLSFAYAGFLMYCGMISQPNAATASLISIAIPTYPNVLGILVSACMVSFLVSQSQYLIGFFKVRE